MTSIEIAKKRKEIENSFKDEANILTGQLTDSRANFEEKMKDLQKICPHIWESGENAIQNFGKVSICTICRKKI